MNYFLFLIVMALCGAGCIGYLLLKEASDAEALQLAGLRGRIEMLVSDNKKVGDENALLTKRMAVLRNAIAGIEKHDQELELVGAKEKAAQDLIAKRLATPSNNLGTITTQDGQTFPDCHLLNVDVHGIFVQDPDGVLEIMFTWMRPAMQKRFGFDPSKGDALTDAQVAYQEAQRKAADQINGN
jgi:hypothetical protein